MEQSLRQFNWTRGTEEMLLGELHPLLRQLGSTDTVKALRATSENLLCPRIDDQETLGVFLEAYQDQLLYPIELPAICRAHLYGSQNHIRELLALDQELGRVSMRADFSRASRHSGQQQLQRLRPLRDHRVVQRYLEAVMHGRAHGWHTVVYGLTLAVYSLPVRQGLANYARQSLDGFIRAAARPLQLSELECRQLLEVQCSDLPAQLEKIVRLCMARLHGQP